MPIGPYFKDNKLSKNHYPVALKLVESEFYGLKYHYERCVSAQENLDSGCKGENKLWHEENRDEMFMICTEYCATVKQVHKLHCQNLMEFFYGYQITEEKQGEHEDVIFYYLFPLDQEKFEKERVPYPRLYTAFKKNEFEKLNKLINKNIDLFKKCLNEKL